MELAGSADYTTTVDVFLRVTTGTVSVPTTAMIDEVTENFSIASGTASATGTIIDNDNAPVATIAPASATEGSDVFNFTLSNLLHQLPILFCID
jgi:hypothetical protein